MSNWSAYWRMPPVADRITPRDWQYAHAVVLHNSKSTTSHAENEVTPKQTATVASLSVFGVGLVAITILARTFKDEFSDFTIAAIATLMFVAFYVLGQWVKRAIDRPPTVEK
jgi:hypothetical protein